MNTQPQEHVYRITCPLETKFNVSRNGCGWEPSDEDYNQHFSDSDCLEALRRVVHQTGGQDLAVHHEQAHGVDAPLQRIDTCIADTGRAEFYFRCNRALDEGELESIANRFRSQLSDGWGESFEQQRFDLETNVPDGDDDLEVQLFFEVAYRKMSALQPYDAATMRPLAEVDDLAAEGRPRAMALRN